MRPILVTGRVAAQLSTARSRPSDGKCFTGGRGVASIQIAYRVSATHRHEQRGYNNPGSTSVELDTTTTTTTTSIIVTYLQYTGQDLSLESSVPISW